MNPTQLPQPRGRVFSPSEMNKSQPDSGDLESSLLQIYHQHHQNSLQLRDQAEKAKKDAISKAGRVSDLLVEAVNGGVQESFVNEKRIEAEIRVLASTIARFMKQTDQWLAASHAINTAVKEIGDFENWMKSMDFDCKKYEQAPIEVPASSDKCLAHWPWMFTPKISLRSSRRNRLIVVTGMFVWGSELILPRMTQWIVFFSEASKVQ
ncbi:hypothetical protein V6N11_009326 [Hibiscus sabdariffa]|uniref:Biogenesis of lysosome-related organelles complex 1 subunit 1 n=2 Tax=Hibiscus sabdariffa TaxID=183260 RepID=A0ABR2PQB7_9ROSI